MMLSLLGLLLSIPTAILLATGNHLAGGVMVLVTGAADMLDGALARVRKSQSAFGAFFDSTADRYVEVVIFGGLVWHFAAAGLTVEAIVTFAALAGSLLVSYARARAEGLGIECKVGILQRPERLIILGVAAALSTWLLTPALWVLAVVTHVTAVQRIIHVHRTSKGQPLGPRA